MNSNNNNQRKPPPSSSSSTPGNPEFHHQPPPGVAPVPPSLDEALQGLVAAYSASQHQQPQQQADPSSKKRSFADMVNMMMQGQQTQQAQPLPPFIQPMMPPHFAPFADIPPPPQMFGFIGSTSVEPPLPFSFSPNPANLNTTPAAEAMKTTTATTPRPPPPPLDKTAWKQILQRFPRCFAACGIQETSFFRHKTQTAPRSGRLTQALRQAAGTSAYSNNSISASGSSTQTCLRRVLRELTALEDDLPEHPAIWLAFDEETPQFCRALITAPNCTPYAYGLFCFDVYIPDSYPAVSPKVQLLTTGGGSVRFSPNLYADGKVCLSLLGTWSGPKWDPAHSTLLQVLVSIQGLILGVENPYYLEPGFGGWEGHVQLNPTVNTATTNTASTSGAAAATTSEPAATADTSQTTESQQGSSNEKQQVGPKSGTSSSSSKNKGAKPETKHAHVPDQHVKRHEDRIREGTVKYALLETLLAAVNVSSGNSSSNNTVKNQVSTAVTRYLQPFHEIILLHFNLHKDLLLHEVKGWVDMMTPTPPTPISFFSPGHQRPPATHKTLSELVTKLEAALQTLPKLLDNNNDENSQKNGKRQNSQSSDKATIRALLSDPKADPAAVKGAIIASKQRAIQEAVEQGDYMKAGLVQCELKELEKVAADNSSSNIRGSVELKLAIARQDIQTAASKGDYITAGKLQAFAQHLEKNLRRLQDLQRRMHEAASQQDYCRAGRFQEQFRILLQLADDDRDTSSSSRIPDTSGNANNWMAALPVGAIFPKPPPAFHGTVNDSGYDEEYGDEFYDDGYGDEY